MLTLLGTETCPVAVGAADSTGGGHGECPIDANGSVLVMGLEK